MYQDYLIDELDHYQLASSLEDLGLIKNQDVNMVVHERMIGSDLQSYLNIMVENGFTAFNQTLSLGEFSVVFDNHFKKESIFQESEHELLKQDVFKLLSSFDKVMESSSMTVLFTIVDSNMCTRFHTDMYDFRMISSYVGQGTCWLGTDNVHFDALKSGGTNEEIVLRESDIQQLKQSDVAIMRGELSLSNVGGVVHRSPAIEHLNQKRIVLRVDSKSLLSSFN